MSCQNRDDLEFVIWRQAQEIEWLKGENAWMRKNVAVVIEKDNELVSENRMLKQQIEVFEKAKNADVPLTNYADVFTKSELWRKPQTENNRLLDIIFKRDQDKTVRVPISDAVVYIVKELNNERSRTL
ncbi:hypothetical protein GU333_04160 [Lactococcus raffinolactis]|uniref:hypothetical protein n=1 Tax=Pseudolactococcus raffinolactis TaxID=1366 RepID=UPI001436CB54|nr:hypothetical protein [Lactococcus raffinolactis]QIW60360.1 hypothetical protein GU333_04160 [Lactococcus raffinolactis]